MPRDADASDFLARDEDGDSLTVSEEVEIDGEQLTVEVIPATRGFMSELEEMGEDEIESDGFQRVLEKYRKPDFRNGDGEVDMATVDSIPLPRLNKLFNTFLIASGVEREALENPEQYLENEGNPNPSA